MNTKRKVDLFRFVTLRSAQHLSKDERNVGFIEHPDPANSAFDSGILGVTDLTQARVNIEAAATAYETDANRLKVVAQVKAINPEMWDFSQRLLKNVQKIEDETSLNPPSQPLDNETLLQLWDNVFFDVWSQKSRVVRQACLQMILASNYVSMINDNTIYNDIFIEEFVVRPVKVEALTLAEKKASILKRVARSTIVIPEGFTREKTSHGNSQYRPLKKGYKFVRRIHEAEIAKIKCAAYESVIREIENLGDNYRRDFEEAQENADTAYRTQYNTAVQTWRTNNKIYVDAVIEENRKNPGFDVEEFIPEDELPIKKFTFDEPLSDDYAQSKLTPYAYDLMRQNSSEHDDVDHLISVFRNMCNQERQKTKPVRPRKRAGAIINGVPIKRVSRHLYDYALSLTEVPVWNPVAKEYSIKKQFFVTVLLDREGAVINGITVDFDIDSGPNFNNGSFSMVSNDTNAITFRLFENDNLNSINDGDRFQFESTINLDGGITLYLAREGHISTNITTGTAGISNPSLNDPLHYGIQNLGVADFRRVEQELCCYVPGEVSHIENVMAKEYQERSTRSASIYEESFSQLDEVERENLSDTSTTSRDEMVNEVSNVITLDRSRNIGLNAFVNGERNDGDIRYGVGVNTDFGFSSSASDSNSTARTFAEEITSRALERVVQFSSSERTRRITKEFEENKRHGFDNRQGDVHVTGVYRWVDKVYKNRLVNYGKKLMYEFAVPEPSRWYKQAVLVEAEENNGLSQSATGSAGTAGALIEPTHPREFEISSADDISIENYASLCAEYGVTGVDPYPNEEVSRSESYSGGACGRDGDTGQTPGFQIPIGYEIAHVKMHGHANMKNNGFLKLTFASRVYQENSRTGNFEFILRENCSGGITGSTSFSYSARKMRGWTVTVTATCRPTQETITTWRQDIYSRIMDAYEEQLKAYNDAATAARLEAEAAQAALENEAEQGRNPRFNDEIVHNELKRLCIEMLMRSFGLDQGKEFYKNDTRCDIPYLPSDRELGDYKLIVEFFEEAFDWQLMAQKFYPYYWADRCQWKELFQSTDSLDQKFQAFLQSGMAKIIVPVKEGHEAAVAFYTETGEIWTGTRLAVETDDEIYLSLVNETYDVDGIVEQTWETVVPTSLNIIQKDSVGLDAYGLPCCDIELDPEYTGGFKKSQNTLQIQTPTAQ